MTESEFLERFDRHIQRMDAHIARMDGYIARMDSREAKFDQRTEVLEKAQAAREERYAQLIEDNREALRQMQLRSEKLLNEFLTESREFRSESRDWREQIRANTQAVLSILDRMNGLDPGGAAA